MKGHNECLTPRDYQMALDSQSACNLGGIILQFADTMRRINAEMRRDGHGGDWRNEHPICRLYAEQILHLAGGGSLSTYSAAHSACVGKAKGIRPENNERLDCGFCGSPTMQDLSPDPACPRHGNSRFK